MITGFNHTSFTVADIERTVTFWTEALGFELASLSPRAGDWQGRVTGVPGAELKVAHLYGHGHHMEFIQYLKGGGPAPALQPSMPGVAHVCIEVDDIHAAWRELLAAGATPQGEICEVATGPVQGFRAAYIRDPGGIVIELLEVAAGKTSHAKSPGAGRAS
jgi:catechol 2,3-dioxygenase-like lactoylglutathione lyase family enzyme